MAYWFGNHGLYNVVGVSAPNATKHLKRRAALSAWAEKKRKERENAKDGN
jgi:hypothetical protein